MRTTVTRTRIAFFASLLFLGAGVPGRAWAQPTGEFLCSGGSHDGSACETDLACPGGACVIAQGVCDGGTDDGLYCDCNNGSCSATPACSTDPTSGTCSGGLFAGSCCNLSSSCSDNKPCTGAQKVCLSGDDMGFSCLNDGQCPGSQCVSTGKVCHGGENDSFSCVADTDCVGGTCEPGLASTPGPTPPPPSCVGDCDGDNSVSISELLTMVNIALGNVLSTACTAGDLNRDGVISIDEILNAVHRALDGCPTLTPTPTATGTPTPPPTAASTATPPHTATQATGTTTPTASGTAAATATVAPPTATQAATETTAPATATAAANTPPPNTGTPPPSTETPPPSTETALPSTETPTPVATAANPTPNATQIAVTERAAGSAVVIPQALSSISGLISSFTQLATGVGGSAASDGGAAAVKTCSGGGTRDFECTAVGAATSYTLTFSSAPPCVLNTAGGGTVSVDGTITAHGIGLCSIPPTSLSNVSITNVHVIEKDMHGTTTLSATFNLTGSVSATLSLASSCLISGLDMTLSGTASVQSGPVDMTVTFTNTRVQVSVDTYSADCVPTKYRMTVDGQAMFSGASIGGSFSSTFKNFTFTDDTTVNAGNDVVTLNGEIGSTCFGTNVTLSTPTELTIPSAVVCATSGAVLVTDVFGSDLVTYTNGNVDVDFGNDGSTEASFSGCLNTQLYQCPGP